MSPSSNNNKQQQPATEGRWTTAEQDLFFEAYSMFGRNWKKIAAVIKTRNNVQCRTHAQHLQRKNTLQHIPQRPATLLQTPERTPTSTPIVHVVPTMHKKTISAKLAPPTSKPMMTTTMNIYQLQQDAILASFRHQLALQRAELSKMRPFFHQQPAATTTIGFSALYRPLQF